MLSSTLDQHFSSLLFAGRSRPSALFNEDDFDYALELQPCDEYRQVAEALPDICEFDDIDFELFEHSEESWPRDSESTDEEKMNNHTVLFDAAASNRALPGRRSSAAGGAEVEVENPETDGLAAPDRHSTDHVVSREEYGERMQLLVKQQRWAERAARRSSIGFQSHFPNNDKDIMDRFLLLLARGVTVRRHQSYKRAERVVLHSSDGCRSIHWDPPDHHQRQQKRTLQPHHYHDHKQRQLQQQQQIRKNSETDEFSHGCCGLCCLSRTAVPRRFGHGEHGDEESQVDEESLSMVRQDRKDKGPLAAWFDRVTNFGYTRRGDFSDLSILSVHPASREDPTLPGMLATEQLRASRDAYNSELSFSVIFEVKGAGDTSHHSHHHRHQDHAEHDRNGGSSSGAGGVQSLDIECDDLPQHFTLIKGFKLLQEQAAKRRERVPLPLPPSPSSSPSRRLKKEDRRRIAMPKVTGFLWRRGDSSGQIVDPTDSLFAATHSVDALRAIKIGGGLLEQRPRAPSSPSKGPSEDYGLPPPSLQELRMANKLPVAQFLGWTSAGTQIWARLRMAGLAVKVSFSWDLRRLILKVRCPRWRLEQMAQQMHLKIKTRDGHLRPFRVSRRDSFVAFGAHGNIFRSSERQQIIDYILRSKIADGGAELDEHTELGRHIVQRFPLHMYSRLLELRGSWVRFWRQEASGQAPAGWSPFSSSYVQTAERLTSSLFFFVDQLLQQPLDGVAEYFGESMAFYFAFQAFYTRWLILPAFVGIVVFAVQLSSHRLDNGLCAPYAVFLMLWMALLLAYWRQQESILAHRWGVLDFEVEETERPQFRGDLVYDENAGEWRKVYPLWRRFGRYLVSVPVIALAVLLTLVIMATVFSSQADMYLDYEQGQPLHFAPDIPLWLYIHGHAGEGSFSSSSSPTAAVNATVTPYPQHTGNFEVGDLRDSRFWAVSFFYPSLYGMLASLLAVIFYRVAKALTEFENHRTGTHYTNHLILKVFAFQFVAIFTSLYYYAFFVQETEQAFARIAVTILSFMSVGQWWAVLLDLAVPALYQRTLLYQMRAQFAAINRRLFAVSRQLQQREDEANSQRMADPEAGGSGEVEAGGAGGSAFELAEARDKLARREKFLHQARSRCWEEALQSRYDNFADYTALIIQIAFILFFGAVFPLAPLLALLNNLALIRLNAYKVCHVRQRPIAIKHSGIGVWSDVLQLLSVGGLLTNCALWGFVSQPLRTWLTPLVGQGGLVLLLFAYEQLVLLFKYWLHVAVPKVPPAVVRAQIRERKSLSRRSFQRHHMLQQQKQQQQQPDQDKDKGSGAASSLHDHHDHDDGNHHGQGKGKGSEKDQSRRKNSSILNWLLRGSLLLPHRPDDSPQVRKRGGGGKEDEDEHEHEEEEMEMTELDHREHKTDEEGGDKGRHENRRPFAAAAASIPISGDHEDTGDRRLADSPFFMDPPPSPPPYDEEEGRGEEHETPPPPYEEEEEELRVERDDDGDGGDYDGYQEEDNYYDHDDIGDGDDVPGDEHRLPSADYSDLTFEEADELGYHYHHHPPQGDGYYEDLPQPPQPHYSFWDMGQLDYDDPTYPLPLPHQPLPSQRPPKVRMTMNRRQRGSGGGGGQPVPRRGSQVIRSHHHLASTSRRGSQGGQGRRQPQSPKERGGVGSATLQKPSRNRSDLLQNIAPLGQRRPQPRYERNDAAWPAPFSALPSRQVFIKVPPQQQPQQRQSQLRTDRASTLRPFQSPPRAMIAHPHIQSQPQPQSPFAFAASGKESRENNPHRANLTPPSMKREKTTGPAAMTPQARLQQHHQQQQQLVQQLQSQSKGRSGGGDGGGGKNGTPNPFSFAAGAGRVTRLEFD